jgi:hypothetical protein
MKKPEILDITVAPFFEAYRQAPFNGRSFRNKAPAFFTSKFIEKRGNSDD